MKLTLTYNDVSVAASALQRCVFIIALTRGGGKWRQRHDNNDCFTGND